jgi:selenocysteine lyase/cysteine desulfurase
VNGFTLGELVVPIDDPLRGHFLTLRTPRAQAICAALKRLAVDTDARADRLRFGFGVYHDEADVDALLERVHTLR